MGKLKLKPNGGRAVLIKAKASQLGSPCSISISVINSPASMTVILI
jgi:hypothetical protein